MSAPPILAPHPKGTSAGAALRKLFLTLFLRGHTSQGLTLQSAPTSIGQRLALMLGLYALFGLSAFAFSGSGVFLISAFLHGFTFTAIGMFLVMSAGETLFNKEEAEILLHRPVTPKTLLWAKVAVLIQVSFYLGVAINFVGFFVGLMAQGGSWLFPIAHLASTALEALFCAGCVVLVYQLCLRWFGRQRLENMMTLMQVVVMAVFIIGSQLLPRVLVGNLFGQNGGFAPPWWLDLIPPGWFAGFDDAIAGSHAGASWALGLIGVSVTALVFWLAFDKLAKTYEEGMQALNESTAPKEGQTRQLRFLNWVAVKSPTAWWLKGSIERVAFVLTAAYLLRDRETKLRVYPSITAVLIMPIMMAITNRTPRSGFSMPRGARSPVSDGLDTFTNLMPYAFAGAFLGFMAMSGLSLMSYSQQWMASEVFRAAPMQGPWQLQRGAMVAIAVMFVLPMMLVLVGISVAFHQVAALPLLLPGAILVPAYLRIPALLEGAVPLSRASEEAKSVGRGCLTGAAMIPGLALAGVSLAARSLGWFWQMLGFEVLLVIACAWAASHRLKNLAWKAID